jgi:predicted nucleic acid-binding protein
MKINLARISTKNLATLAQRTIEASSKPVHTVVKNQPLFDAVIAVYNVYDGVYVKDTYSGKGVLVAEADTLRDRAFAGSKYTLEGMTLIDGFSGQQEAKELYAIFEKYGLGLDRYSYAEQSAQQKKLIEELDLPANTAKIEKLHLTEIFGLHKAAYQKFEQQFGEQTEANAALRQQESATSVRISLEAALRNYFSLVDAMKSVAGWKELNAELTEIAKSFNTPSASKSSAAPAAPTV